MSEKLTCTVEESAVALGISRTLAYAMAKDGTLPTIRFRRRILVPKAALLEMLAGQGQKLGQESVEAPAA